jgi:hypothetical protein
VTSPPDTEVKVILLFPSEHQFGNRAQPEAALDIVTLTTMEWAIWQTGEPVMFYDEHNPPNLSGVKNLALCGHGAPGTIEHIPAATIAALLTDPQAGCRNTLQHLVVTACFAGIPVNGADTSTIAVLAAALQIRNLAISGANGPSVKHPSTGSIRSLAIPSVTHVDLTLARATQAAVLWEMASKYEFAKVVRDHVGTFKKYSVAAFNDELQNGNRWRTWHSISSEYATRATEFFRVFLERLERVQGPHDSKPRSILYSREDGLTTVYWDGNQVVTGTPPSWPVFVG